MTLTSDYIKAKTALVLILVIMVGTGLFWEKVLTDGPGRTFGSAYQGRLAKPTEPTLIDPLKSLVNPTQYRPMVITHIPEISMDQKMPHPFVGACINCHLINGGDPAGSQFKTPIGAVLEKISKNVVKLGPPITPTSNRPHPPAGRCIKCHDIVVQVPVKKTGFVWE